MGGLSGLVPRARGGRRLCREHGRQRRRDRQLAAECRPQEHAAVQSPDVRDGSLNDEDVGQGAFVNFPAFIGSVASRDCIVSPVTGIGGRSDHLLLTAVWTDAGQDLSYSIENTANGGPADAQAFIKACNPTSSTIDDDETHFTLLVVDAQ
jgi:hypothetical protein